MRMFHLLGEKCYVYQLRDHSVDNRSGSFIWSKLCATYAGVGFACVEFALLVFCISQLHTRTGAAPAHPQIDIAGFISRL